MGLGSIKYIWLGCNMWLLTKWGMYVSKGGRFRNESINEV